MKMAALRPCVLLLAALISLSSADLMKNVCVPGSISSTASPKPFPAVPDVFSAHINMNVVGNKTTRYIHELFDAPNNRAMLYETMATGDYNNITLTGKEIYNFYSNQLIEVVDIPPFGPQCGVSQLDGKGKDTFIFGNSASSASGFSAKTAFLINTAIPPTYMGRKTLETGTLADWWKDCVYIDAIDATVNVEWYFAADQPDWISALGTSVPVMLKVYGKANKGGPPRDVNNVYTFNDFLDFLNPHMQSYFQIPRGAVCPHMAAFHQGGDDSKHDIPNTAANGYFQFRAELVQKMDDGIAYITPIREMHDESIKMSRFDLNPAGLIDNLQVESTNLALTVIHDFETGIGYVIDRLRFNCTALPLVDMKSLDVVSIDDSHVRMKTVREFFGFSNDNPKSRMNWTYVGPQTIRDIKADVYEAERIGWPEGGDPNSRSVWEMAFMSSGDLKKNAGDEQYEVSEPIRLWIKTADMKETTYNIFDFNEEQPDLYHYDFSTCYSDDQKQEVQFKLPAGNNLPLIEANKKQFYYFLLLELAGSLDLTPSRITRLSFQAADNKQNILVRFTLLDPPSVKASVSGTLPQKYLITRKEVLDIMQAAIDKQEFVIAGGDLTTGGTIVQMTAIKGSLDQSPKTITNTNTIVKLDTGAAAGIGIALFVVGLGMGVLLIFLINKFRGQSLPNLNLSFAPKQFKNDES